MGVNFEPASVGVVNHNADTLQMEFVCSALAQAEQVIVVDNHSLDSSVDMQAAQFASEARPLAWPDQCGWRKTCTCK